MIELIKIGIILILISIWFYKYSKLDKTVMKMNLKEAYDYAWIFGYYTIFNIVLISIVLVL